MTWYGGWGVNCRLLPYIEQTPLYNASNQDFPMAAAENTTVITQTIPLFMCPSDPNPQPYDNGSLSTGVSNYGWCGGDWYIWGGVPSLPSRGAFGPNLSRGSAAFTDGLSNTIIAAEVKCRQSQRTNCISLSSLMLPSNVLSPMYPPSQLVPMVTGQSVLGDSGHTCWADGQIAQSGVTTAWTPDTRVMTSSSIGKDPDVGGKFADRRRRSGRRSRGVRWADVCRDHQQKLPSRRRERTVRRWQRAFHQRLHRRPDLARPG